MVGITPPGTPAARVSTDWPGAQGEGHRGAGTGEPAMSAEDAPLPAEADAAAEALAATHLTEEPAAGGESSPEGAATPAAQDSTLSAASTRSKSPGTKTFRRIGTELLEMVRPAAARPCRRRGLQRRALCGSTRPPGSHQQRLAAHPSAAPPDRCLRRGQKTLSKAELEESAERLSKPKEVIKASTVRPKAVQLKYKYKKELRGGKGGFAELLVPAKSSSKEEKQVRGGPLLSCLRAAVRPCCSTHVVLAAPSSPPPPISAGVRAPASSRPPGQTRQADASRHPNPRLLACRPSWWPWQSAAKSRRKSRWLRCGRSTWAP